MLYLVDERFPGIPFKCTDDPVIVFYLLCVSNNFQFPCDEYLRINSNNLATSNNPSANCSSLTFGAGLGVGISIMVVVISVTLLIYFYRNRNIKSHPQSQSNNNCSRTEGTSMKTFGSSPTGGVWMEKPSETLS